MVNHIPQPQQHQRTAQHGPRSKKKERPEVQNRQRDLRERWPAITSAQGTWPNKSQPAVHLQMLFETLLPPSLRRRCLLWLKLKEAPLFQEVTQAAEGWVWQNTGPVWDRPEKKTSKRIHCPAITYLRRYRLTDRGSRRDRGFWFILQSLYGKEDSIYHFILLHYP